MTVVKSFPAAVVYAFAITSMNDVMRYYDTSSIFYDLHLFLNTNMLVHKNDIKALSVQSLNVFNWPAWYCPVRSESSLSITMVKWRRPIKHAIIFDFLSTIYSTISFQLNITPPKSFKLNSLSQSECLNQQLLLKCSTRWIYFTSYVCLSDDCKWSDLSVHGFLLPWMER